MAYLKCPQPREALDAVLRDCSRELPVIQAKSGDLEAQNMVGQRCAINLPNSGPGVFSGHDLQGHLREVRMCQI